MSISEPITDPSATIATPIEEAAASEAAVEAGREQAALSDPPVSVFEASNAGEGEIIRGMLETEGIEAIYESRPGLTMILGGDFSGSVLVPGEDADRARELVDTFLASAQTAAT
jgi:hypothetical protein